MAARKTETGGAGAGATPTLPAGREIVLTRVFDAPRELVFQAWTDPKHVAQWWGPQGFTNPVCELDVRPGGAIRIVMRGPAGVEYPMTGVYREMVPPERLVFLAVVDDDGANVHFQVLTILTLAERGGKTTLTLRAKVVSATPESAPMLAGMEQGWSQSLRRFADYLAAL
jgi:uncharacterized protein YndB with AHSA1/START domain